VAVSGVDGDDAADQDFTVGVFFGGGDLDDEQLAVAGGGADTVADDDEAFGALGHKGLPDGG